MKRFAVKTLVDAEPADSAVLENGQVAAAVKSLVASLPENGAILIYRDGYTSPLDQLEKQVSTLKKRVRSLEKAGQTAKKKTATRKKKAD